MAKVKKRRLLWEPSLSSNVIGYKLYWAENGEVTYNSPCAMIGNVTEIILPDQVPSFPVVKGPVDLGVTAVNEIGNESDMMIFPAPFQFSVPEAPMNPTLEALKEYHVYPVSSIGEEDRASQSDLAADPDHPEIE